MKRILSFILILSTLICAASCTDRGIHMDDIKDEYERNIYIPEPDEPIYGQAVIAAEGVPYGEMLDLIEQYIAVDGEPDFLYPREGEFETEDGEKFISKVGICNVYYYLPWPCWIKFKLRIFDSKGYLIVEDDIVVYAGMAGQDFDSWWDWSSLEADDEILKYWKAIAAPSV